MGAAAPVVAAAPIVAAAPVITGYSQVSPSASLLSLDPLLLDVMSPTLLELSMLPRGRLTPTSMVDTVLDMPDMVAMLAMVDMAMLLPPLWLLPLSSLATPTSPPLPP